MLSFLSKPCFAFTSSFHPCALSADLFLVWNFTSPGPEPRKQSKHSSHALLIKLALSSTRKIHVFLERGRFFFIKQFFSPGHRKITQQKQTFLYATTDRTGMLERLIRSEKVLCVCLDCFPCTLLYHMVRSWLFLSPESSRLWKRSLEGWRRTLFLCCEHCAQEREFFMLHKFLTEKFMTSCTGWCVGMKGVAINDPWIISFNIWARYAIYKTNETLKAPLISNAFLAAVPTWLDENIFFYNSKFAQFVD